MKDRTYRRMFLETSRQARQRHNRPYVPTPVSYGTRRSRTGDGYEVVTNEGRVVAQAFDSEAEASQWIADNPPN